MLLRTEQVIPKGQKEEAGCDEQLPFNNIGLKHPHHRVDEGGDPVDEGKILVVYGGIILVDGGITLVDGGIAIVDGGIALVDGGIALVDGGEDPVDDGEVNVERPCQATILHIARQRPLCEGC